MSPPPPFLPCSTVRVPSFTISGRPRLVEGGCPRNLGSVPRSPTALRTEWDTGPGSGPWAGQGPGRGWDPRRLDLSGSRECLYCCRLAPPSVFLAVSAAVSYFQSQEPPLGGWVLSTAPSSFTQWVSLQLLPFLWDPSALALKPVANRTSV